MGNITSYSQQQVTPFDPTYAEPNAAPKLFDPLLWVGDTEMPAPAGALLERRVGFPLATVLRDTIPPTGFVSLNDSLGSGGIRIHRLSVKDASGTVYLSGGTLVVQDDLDLTVRPGGVLGGINSPSVYEIIGDGSDRSLTLYLDPTNGAFPQIGAIEFGVTSRKAKQYTVEAMRAGDRFRPLVTMISSEETRDFFLIPFTGDPRLEAVRIRYSGDYFTPTATGDVTASAYDLSSGVEAVQLSHYPDFRDSHDLSAGTPGELPGGWMPFTEGTSVFGWNMVNHDRLWKALPGVASAALRLIQPVGTAGDYVASDLTHLYSLEKGTLTPRKTFSGGETVSAIVLHQGQIFVATSAGRVFITNSGKSYDLKLTLPVGPGESVPPAIRSMVSYNGRLYIGTDASQAEDETQNRGLVYSWDGEILRLPFTISETGVSVAVCSLCAANDKLFIGTQVTSGSLLAKVYTYDGVGLTVIFAPSVNAVQALGLTLIDNRLWAALSDGRIEALTFSGTTLGVWQDVYSGSATTYYQISGQLSANFVWIPNDAGLLVYFKDVANDAKFALVQNPPSYITGLTAKWYNTPSNWTTIPASGVTPVFTGTDGPINWPNLTTTHPTGVVTNGNVAVWTGYIRAFESGTHTFYTEVDDGVRLYIDGTRILNKWFNNPGIEYLTQVELTAGQWVPFRMEYYASGDTASAQSIVLSWSTPSNAAKRLVPRDAFTASLASPTRPAIRYISTSGATMIAAAADGRVYSLDTETLRNRKRFVYARFRDAAGNTTPLPGVLGGAEGIPNVSYTDPLNSSKTVLEGIFDSVMEGGETGTDGTIKTQGRIWQVTTASKVVGVTTYTPGSLLAQYVTDDTVPLYGPDRWVRQRGIFESDPFYVATLAAWSTLDIFSTIPAPSSPNPPDAGMEHGAEILISVRAGSTREECLSQEWGTPVKRSTIISPGSTGALHTVANLQTVVGNWLQYKLELVTATQDLTPVVHSATLSYTEAKASYFFTRIFDTSMEVNAPPYPLWKRGLLTENSLGNGGRVLFGYTTDDDASTTFEFSRYTPITPNRVFEIPNPASKIRFGILLVSLEGDYQAIVNEFAVQLDAGDADLYLMKN